MNISVLGVDLAKSLFQLHGVNDTGKVVMRRKVTRAKLRETVMQLEPCLIAMEACSSAHYWARAFEEVGHEVRLISPQFVKPYVKSNKNDAADAEAICEAAGRPTMRFVAIKQMEQQDIQSLHRARSLLVKQRPAVANQIRGLMGEYGVVVPQGINTLRKRIPEKLEDAQNDLSVIAREVIQSLYEQLCWFDERVGVFDRRIAQVVRDTPACQRLVAIPGVGPMTATALFSAVNHAKEFHNGRHLAAWLGLVPRQHSSGGKQTLLGISKRGDRHLRTLSIHGARAVIFRKKNDEGKEARWLRELIARRGINRATVALANKIARRAWVVLNKGESYCPAS